MARNQGLLGFSGNLEVAYAAPLDARAVVGLLSDLTASSTFGNYWYKGMVVAVVNDPVAANNGLYILVGNDPSVQSNWQKVGAGAGGGGTWSGTTEENEVGIPAGQTFVDLTFSQFAELVLRPEKFPTLVAPSGTFSKSVQTLQEIGATINITFTATFNRGSITPAYGTSGYRSGLPTSYNYTGTGLPSTVSSTSLTDEQDVNNYSVVAGNQSWSVTINYSAGEQPKSSKGNNYDSPLPAGSVGPYSTSITGVYPYFATTVNIDTLTKQPLVQHGSTLTISLVAEDGTNKQTFDLPDAFGTVTKIQQLNTLSNQWVDIDMGQFTVSDIQRTINGNSVEYNRWVHNGATIGARQIRIFF